MISGCEKNGLAAVLAVVIFSGLTHAQTPNKPPEAQPAQVKTIFDFKPELKLTDKQETEIREILADLNRELQLNRAKLTILSIELDDLIKKESSPEQIKKNLQDQAHLQSSTRYADIIASRKINKVLSPEQLAKWRDIQVSQKGNAKAAK